MPNILLTQKCIRSCPYCFARKHMHDAPPEDILKWEDLIYIVDFFQSSGDTNISLLGGEPFLHPDIVDYILYIISRGMHVTVFTSGVVGEAILQDAAEKLDGVNPAALTFVVNLNNPKETSFSETSSITRFLTIFSRYVSLSINVYKLNFDYSFAIQYINKFGLQKHIRLGLAHPIPGKKNMCIPVDKFREMAVELINYLPTLDAFDIHVGFDCGMPMCIFTDEEIGLLYKHSLGQVNFRCGPAIDIGTDMSVWSCFPLSGYNKVSLFDFQNAHELSEYFNQFHHNVRVEVGGIFEKCDYCEYRHKGLCSGGCLSHGLNSIINEPKIRNEKVYAHTLE